MVNWGFFLTIFPARGISLINLCPHSLFNLLYFQLYLFFENIIPFCYISSCSPTLSRFLLHLSPYSFSLKKRQKRKKPLKYGVLFLGYCLCTSMLRDKLLKTNLCALQKHCPCSLPHQNLPRVHHCAWYPAGIRN